MTAALALIARIEADLAELRRLLDAPAEPEPEEWLEPSVIAYRLGIGEAYVRRLCDRGLDAGDAGVRRVGGRWLATADAIDGLRRV
uniref:hypothetical protein n=1 Tax=Altererythrobacter segetis TaxID=1104773 RepID=UPI00140D8A09|nr:hypothetical protein [Altererythrobacter segetis]